MSERRGPRLHIVPVTFQEANAFVESLHRHNRPVHTARACLGVATDDAVVGVAILGNPVARMLNDGWTLEVLRTCTDGTPNANSCLYGAAWRVTQGLGYRRLVTYTQDVETGASLKATGWVPVKFNAARAAWGCPSRPRPNDVHYKSAARIRWDKTATVGLEVRPPFPFSPDEIDGQLNIFGESA